MKRPSLFEGKNSALHADKLKVSRTSKIFTVFGTTFTQNASLQENNPIDRGDGIVVLRYNVPLNISGIR